MKTFLHERHNIKELNSYYIETIVTKLYGNLLFMNSDVKYVKIWIFFFDDENTLMYPYFFTKDKINKFETKKEWYCKFLLIRLLNTLALIITNRILNKKTTITDFEIIIRYTI